MSKTVSTLISLAGLFMVLSVFVQPASGQAAAGGEYDPSVNYDCNRDCLIDNMNRVLAAMVAHDASTLPLARNVKYTENGQIMKLTDGFWATASALPAQYKTFIADPQSGEVAVMAVPLEMARLCCCACA